MIVLAIIGYALLVIFELIPLFRKKLWCDFWVYTVIGILSFAIAVLLCLEVKIPSPVKPIRDFVVSIFGK